MEIKLICFPSSLYLCLPLSTSSISCSPVLLLSPPTLFLHAFISEVECVSCLLPSSLPLSCFLLSHYHATAGQAGASSTICVRFLYPTMERKAIRHLLAALKVFIGRRLEFILVIPYQERAMLPQIHLFISFSFLSVALLAQCKKGNFSLCSPCKWVLDNQLWLTYTVGQRKSRKRVGKHSMSLEFYNRERDY